MALYLSLINKFTMKKLDNIISENPYVRECKDTIFTVLVRHAIMENEELSFLKDKEYIHGLLSYPAWTTSSDIFMYIRKDYLAKLQRGEVYYVFDASTEGFHPIRDMPFFTVLYHNCKKYKVNPRNVIFVSANLRDEKNINRYANEHGVPPLRVFSFPSFEQVIAVDDRRARFECDLQYKQAVTQTRVNFKDKLFSSLSRVPRQYRAIGTFLLCQSDIAKYGLISHDKLENIGWLLSDSRLPEYTEEDFIRWNESLPMIADRTDFNVNWAINTPYRHIHDQTMFQIVNETLVEDYNNEVLFYSEKSFRPIAYFQPFVIYGNRGANKFLQTMGYKLYDDWFDLSFDDDPDPVNRYRRLLASVTEAVNELNALSTKDKLRWRFKNEEKLKHNFNTMIRSNYSKEKLSVFLKDFG